MSHQLTTKQQYWADTLARAEQSSLSVADFARDNHLNAQDLYRWRNQLKRVQQRTEKIETRFSQVMTTNFSTAPSLSITIGASQLQFDSLPDPQWLATLLKEQGASL